MNLNPAITGQFDGKYRYMADYRSQWSSVTVPYRTLGIHADARNIAGTKGANGGLSLFHDKTGDSRFTTTAFNLAGSYHRYLNKDSTYTLSAGTHLGVTNRTIDYTGLEFDAQYNGVFYDNSAPSNETFTRSGRFYANLNAGVYFSYQPAKRKKIAGGFSLYNITGPKQSFYDDPAIRLNRRLAIHADGIFKIQERFDVLPAVLYRKQGAFQEFISGAYVRYIVLDVSGLYRAVYLGGWVRTRDAGYISVGLDYDSWTFGISYDVNVSGLRPASNSQGGFEVHLIRILRNSRPLRTPYIICPDYI